MLTTRRGDTALAIRGDLVINHVVHAVYSQLAVRANKAGDITDLKLVLNSGRSAWSDRYRLLKVAMTMS